MGLFKVSANPRGGTAYQFVNADSEEEAVQKAKDNPSGWKTPALKGNFDEWYFRVHERGASR